MIQTNAANAKARLFEQQAIHQLAFFHERRWTRRMDRMHEDALIEHLMNEIAGCVFVDPIPADACDESANVVGNSRWPVNAARG